MHYYFPFQKLIQSKLWKITSSLHQFPPFSFILRQENTHISQTNGAAALLRQSKRQERAVDTRGRREDPCICSQPWDWQLDLSPSESRYVHSVSLSVFLHASPNLCFVLRFAQALTDVGRAVDYDGLTISGLTSNTTASHPKKKNAFLKCTEPLAAGMPSY